MCVPSLITPLRALGIGVSRRLTLQRGPGHAPWPLHVRTSQRVPAGSSMALVPDAAMWGVNALVDLDEDGLVPDPVDMLSILGDRYPSLDVFYMAYFLSCHAFRTQPGWHADRLHDILASFPDIASANGLGATLAREVELLERFSQDFVTPPLDAFLAAFYYTQVCSFQGQSMQTAQGDEKMAPRTPPGSADWAGSRRLTCAALIDVLPRCAADTVDGPRPNVVLRRLTLGDATLADWAATHKIRGARQSMKGKDGKDDTQQFWQLEATQDIAANTPLVLPIDVLGTP